MRSRRVSVGWNIQELTTFPLTPLLFVSGHEYLVWTEDSCLDGLDLGVGCTSKRLPMGWSKETSTPSQSGLLAQVQSPQQLAIGPQVV